MKELSETSLEKMLTEAGHGDPSGWTARVREGKPADEIVAEVEDSRPDLVIVGTHGRGGFRRFLLGSVASDVARRSPSTCLVVPPAGTRSHPA
jgi:nucleotide-binding universal stress UspA family protein